MLHLLAADAVLLLHLLFICLVVFGGLAAARRPWFALLHLPAATWGILVEAMGWYCPLTDLENALLRQAGEHGYAGGFTERILSELIYPAGLTRGTQMLLAAMVLLINAAIYGWIAGRWLRSRHRRR